MIDDGARRFVVRAVKSQSAEDPDDAVEYIHVPQSKDGMAARDILAALRQRGLRRILVEGGAATLSRFLAAGCLNRLHVMTAPMIIGSGPVGLTLGDIDRLDQALRPVVSTFTLPGGDILFDCAFKDKP
jgi:diaminohydroxyphosphoribosylaminopyrimidine deaminase/5-amino-6-(5-phosphoribosylamino)uracil reductase